jgi:hypothetical protein
MTRTADHQVLSLEIGRHLVPITWGRLSLTQDEPMAGVLGLMSWSLAAELADFDLLDPAEYEIRAELDNSEVLVGRANLISTNGRQLHLQSSGAWKGLAGW